MTKLIPHFSLTRRAGGFVFVSGQLPFDEDMQIVEGDIVVQTRQCLSNLEGALKTEGLTLADAVKITVWLTQREDFPRFNETYAEYFPDLAPVRTTVGSSLMVPGALIEMDAQAWAG
nr:protein DfrA-like [Nerophis lumbriciformis]